MNRIIPTILASNRAELELLVRTAETFTDYVSIDIMDGEFAPSKSITAEDVIAVKPKLKFEVDLMVNNPRKQIAEWARAGAEELDFYLESVGDNTQDLINETKNHGMRVGLTTLPDTPVFALEQYAADLDSIRFFSGHLGYYGGELNEAVLPKIQEARKSYPNMIFGIDGGVSLENIKRLKEAGINYFAVGSRIMKTPDPSGAYNKFVAAIK